MISDKEIAEYRSLCSALGQLHEKYLRRRRELRELLEETAALRRKALLVLAKANRLTRHLTGRQRHTSGLGYHLGDIRSRINQYGPAYFQGALSLEERDILPELQSEMDSEFQADHGSLRELRRKGLLIIGMIDTVRKKLLQLDLLEMRCRELICSTNKALEAFRFEAGVIRRKLYPFGIFSAFFRAAGGLFGKAYFTIRDMEDISALGTITGHVLKIADSPII